MKNIKKTTNEFKNDILNIFNDEYTLVDGEEYINNKTKIKVRHKCGYEYDVIPVHFIRKERLCPKCHTTHSRNKNNEIINEEIMSLTNNEYILDGDFNGTKKPIKIKHLKCNLSWEYSTYDNFKGTSNRKGRRCPFCEGKVSKKYFTEDYIITCLKLNKIYDEYDIERLDIENNNIVLNHKNCNTSNEYNIRDLIKRKNNKICKYCYPHRMVNRSVEDLKMQYSIKFKGKENFEIIETKKYIGAHEHLELLCLKCKSKIKMSPTNLLAGKGCYNCNNINSSSNKEKELLDFIKSIYSGTIITNDRTILNGKEIDIYLPDKQIAFEFDGLYWHSDSCGKDSKYHINKTKQCLSKNVRLIHIFEDEWDYNIDIVKDKIKYILGLVDNKIYARSCKIQEIKNSKIKNEFLNKNHIQGEDKSSINLGLYYKDELVSIMTFCKPRVNLGQNKNSIYDYELSRYATLLNTSVIGGFSKLLSYFNKKYNNPKIITYADRRFSDGNLYLKNGFTLEHYSNPNYFYLNSNCNIRENRFKYRKSELKNKFPNIFSENKSEKQIMKEAGYSIIYDCGTIVFTLN